MSPVCDHKKVISRRTLLAFPALAACSRRSPGFDGYAFIANQEGQAVAAVDLGALAVAKHIPLDAAPTEIAAAAKLPAVYALTPATGMIHEIETGHLRLSRRLGVGGQASGLQIGADEKTLYVLTREPRSLCAISTATLQINWRVALPEPPENLQLSPDSTVAAISSASCVRLVDLRSRTLSNPLAGDGEFGALRFLSDGKTLIAARRADQMLSLYDVATSLQDPRRGLITHLRVGVRPEQLCFSADGGQLFVTGPGMDAVVIVYPYHTPEVGETVLAGHAPGALAASESLLFIASPESGQVTVMNIASHRVIGVVQVGSDPGFVAVTPGDQYALVLNRASGDMAVLSVRTIAANANRYKSAALLTVIPVGSRPVSAAVRAV
jgi:DNA-binding beta-propeller fold protein YncE